MEIALKDTSYYVGGKSLFVIFAEGSLEMKF
jgi:hypothetical protein